MKPVLRARLCGTVFFVFFSYSPIPFGVNHRRIVENEVANAVTRGFRSADEGVGVSTGNQ